MQPVPFSRARLYFSSSLNFRLPLAAKENVRDAENTGAKDQDLVEPKGNLV